MGDLKKPICWPVVLSLIRLDGMSFSMCACVYFNLIRFLMDVGINHWEPTLDFFFLNALKPHLITSLLPIFFNLCFSLGAAKEANYGNILAERC